MSADCFFVVHHCLQENILKNELLMELKKYNFGACFTPSNALLFCGQIQQASDTFMFEPTDSPATNSSELVVGADHCAIDGVFPPLPISERVVLLQKLASLCLMHSDALDIYISEDNPYLPDYLVYEIKQDQVCDVLLSEYQKEERYLEPVPCICLRIAK